MSPESTRLVEAAARLIAAADAILVSAGAGMGVDSGLPDFRGDQGFWKAYPPYARLGLSFVALANPRWFETEPEIAWGFYGHRLNLYRATSPHGGFAILRRLARTRPLGGFVFTSNVDGQFQRAGFDPDRILEVHGSIGWLQCMAECGIGLFEAPPHAVPIDLETMRAREPLPTCPRCGTLARPNVLMFGDSGWDASRTELQEFRLSAWLRSIEDRSLAIVECGAGLAVPTVRAFSERLVRARKATLLRINIRDPQVPPGQLSLPLGALAALREILAQYREIDGPPLDGGELPA